MSASQAISDAPATPIDLRAARHSVTSQDGENGVIGPIFRAIGTTTKVCVEFGAYDLRTNSNVFPLWASGGWHAVLIEGDQKRFRRLEREYAEFRRTSPPAAGGSVDVVRRFVAPAGKDGLDSILDERWEAVPPSHRAPNGGPGPVDLLSIDIDGLDDQVWAGLTRHRPRVVIIEHNPSIPPHLSIHGPSSPNAVGASALALRQLGAEKGYTLVCCTVCNCIFVEREYGALFKNAGDLEALFDRSSLCYAMSTFDGGLAFSRRPSWGFNPFSAAPRHLEATPAPWRPPSGLLAYAGLWLRTRRKGLVRVARRALGGSGA